MVGTRPRRGAPIVPRRTAAWAASPPAQRRLSPGPSSRARLPYCSALRPTRRWRRQTPPSSTSSRVGLPWCCSGGTWTTHPATVGTACDDRDPSNWGAPTDPLSPCWEYLPVVRVSGDLTLASGDGQGILLVDGDLSIGTSYSFYGLLMVRGRINISASSGGTAIFGGVAAGSLGTPSQPSVGVAIRYSKCMIDNVLLSSGMLVPLPSRAWKQLY